MARCARSRCGRWRPDALAKRGRAGLMFSGEWYCSPQCLEDTAREALAASRHSVRRTTAPAPIKLGLLLVHQQSITPELLRLALQEQRNTGLRLGAQLQAMGVVQGSDVLRALAVQAGVGYVTRLDPAIVLSGPGGLSPETVRALGVVPFEISPETNRIKVACMAPLPRLALAAMRELTGASVEPLLVSDEDWAALVKAYGKARPRSSSRPVTVRSVHDAAARIVEAAGRGRMTRMAHARCDPYVWVRLEGEDQSEDLLLSLEDSLKEHRWQAEHTSR